VGNNIFGCSKVVGEWMKYFLLKSHIARFGKRAPEVAHRHFLQQGYDEGHFLLSALTIRSESEILIARAESVESLGELISYDRYGGADDDLVQFDEITEFAPTSSF
jgi:hypothetical protein